MKIKNGICLTSPADAPLLSKIIADKHISNAYRVLHTLEKDKPYERIWSDGNWGYMPKYHKYTKYTKETTTEEPPPPPPEEPITTFAPPLKNHTPPPPEEPITTFAPFTGDNTTFAPFT